MVALLCFYRRPGMKKTFFRVLIVILSAIFVAGAAVYFIVAGRLDKVDRFDTNDALVTLDYKDAQPTEETESSKSTSEESTESQDGSGVLNILLVGQPQKSEDTKAQCDAIVLCTIHKLEKKVILTSFHSDTLVSIPGHNERTLSEIGELGGVGLLNTTLEHNFGVHPDYNIAVNVSDFIKIIDNLGGVSVTLVQGEADCLNAFGEEQISEKWMLKAGTNRLTGVQALHYARMTQSGTDYGRNDRQKRLMIAFLNEFKHADLKHVKDLAVEIAQMLSTDMTDQQIIQLVGDVLPLLGDTKIVDQSIPVEGQYSMERVGKNDVLVMNEDQRDVSRELILKTIGK